MPKPLPPILDYLLNDVLVEEDGITTRRMFGGYGIYRYGKIFAGIMKEELHLKAPNDALRQELEATGSTQFTYTFKNTGKTTTMPYWALPNEIIDNREILKKWCEKVWMT